MARPTKKDIEETISLVSEPTNNYRQFITSYRLKHIVEKVLNSYVSDEETQEVLSDMGYHQNKKGYYRIRLKPPYDTWLYG